MIVLLAVLLAFGPIQTGMSLPDVVAKAADATVVLLCGEGAGRLASVSTGVVVRSDGVILVAYHSLKDAKEVQVRLRNGDVFDHVALIGVDERRDIAAVRISATHLTTMPIKAVQDSKVGEPAYSITSSNGLAWSTSEGILSSFKTADEIPGAGTGYRVIQFTAKIGPGASGGPLVDSSGSLIGIITRGFPTGPGFAVPVESVIGLADGASPITLGGGSALQMPSESPSVAGAAAAAANVGQMLRSAKTLAVFSKTVFFTADSLDKEFQKAKGFPDLGLALVTDARVADISIQIDRPLFTYNFTYVVTDKRTSRIIASGKVVAFDGSIAAGKIADDIVKKLNALRQAK